ncbi:putative ATP-dependent RNA helicase DDX11-like protein 8-like protein [Gorgonomyces haynaldii]|nr:putative ATP-dependent RNA helicase DDX11-like protein 8-like protein [Gorgonomyces haynaldii]
MTWLRAHQDDIELPEKQPDEPDWLYEQTIQLLKSQRQERIDEGNHRPRQIIYTSRTHSQLQQFVQEVRKVYPDCKLVTLGSRRNLCVNPEVQKLKNVSFMNDKCLDMKCDYNQEELLTQFVNEIDGKIQDIEDLYKLGTKTKTCAYYATRQAIRLAEIVCVPYNLIFQQAARESSGLILKDNIVIVDEAHNIIDAINQMHSIQIPLTNLKTCLNQLESYHTRYQSQLNARTNMFVKQIQLVVKKLISMAEKPEKMYQADAFTLEAQLDHINLFVLVDFMKKSKLANKLHGFGDKENQSPSTEQKVNEAEYKLQRENHLSGILDFLLRISEPERDGRILIQNGLKYLLLNPAQVFEPVVKESRSLVLCGGTMSPMNDFKDQLLPGTDIFVFSCGHVIPKNQLLPMIVSQDFRFTFEKRLDPQLLDRLGKTLLSLSRSIPKGTGMVVFFGSYQYLDSVVKHLKQLEFDKQLFVESNTSNHERVLELFTNQIGKQGSILFAVVGGKMSEGINFSNDMCRLVVMVGIPFANVKSPELVEKLKFVSETTSSQEFYENMCMKQVNQCIGRAIRHKNDYAAICLLDERYANKRLFEKLPKWIRDCDIQQKSVEQAVQAIQGFFRQF